MGACTGERNWRVFGSGLACRAEPRICNSNTDRGLKQPLGISEKAAALKTAAHLAERASRSWLGTDHSAYSMGAWPLISHAHKYSPTRLDSLEEALGHGGSAVDQPVFCAGVS